MNKVRLTPEAAADLADLKVYISETLGNPIAADGTIRGITNSLRVLQSHSEAGPSIEAKSRYKTDLCYLVCGNYIAVYRAEDDRVSIARVINSRQDYMRVLFSSGEV